MTRKRKVLACIMSIIMLITLCISQLGITAHAASRVRVVVDGNELVTDQGAVIVDGRTLLPVRAVAEAVGADVEWDNASQTATITTDDAVIKIKIGSYSLQITSGGATSSVSMDVPAQIINSRTMVPIRVVAESLGLGVYWSQDAYTAYISSDGSEIIAQTAIAGTAGANSSEGFENLFDCNVATKWCVTDFTEAYVIVKLDTAVSMTGFTLATANDTETYPGRNPISWTIYGCNAASDPSASYSGWNVVDVTESGALPDANYGAVTYSGFNKPQYQYYMIKITANGGASAMQLAEFSIRYEGCSYWYIDYDENYENAPVVGTYTTKGNDFVLKLVGDWDLIENEEYKQNLINLFFSTYPRLYARFGTEDEPKTVRFVASRNINDDILSSAVPAYSGDDMVVISVEYAITHPDDLGFLSHELTHTVQCYDGKLVYGGDAWWTENMANYGGFRYYHWAKQNVEAAQIHSASDAGLQDWGWQPYGNNSWFFAYMDYKYPTTKDASGNLSYGLIDSINHLIKSNSTGEEYDDDPYDTTTEMNKLVKKITGYDCFESLRLQYVKELKAGTWKFTGFGDYPDNFITENLPGVENPSYPKNVGISAVAGTAGASSSEGYENLFDSNWDTKWCVTNFTRAYVIMKMDEAVSMTGYTMSTANDTETYPGRNPVAFTIYGCNADSDPDESYSGWHKIVSIEDEDLPQENYFTQGTVFDLTGGSLPEYRYYMLVITENGGDNAMQISGFSILH